MNATIETKMQPAGCLQGMVSLRPNEFLILIDHYETLATQLEIEAIKYGKATQDAMLDLAGVYQSRATEIRKQANAKVSPQPGSVLGHYPQPDEPKI